MNDLKNQLANERQRAELAQKKEKEYREKADKSSLEYEKALLKLQTLESQQKRALEQATTDLETKLSKFQRLYEE